MHVCFVCPNAAELFTPSGRAVGGVERQVGLLGRELARRGHRVTFVVHRRPGLASGVFRLVAVDLRKDLPRGLGRIMNAAHLWRGLERADADCMILHGSDPQAVDLAFFARVRRRRFVFMAASDDDFLLKAFHTDRSRNLLFRQGLRLADAVVVQTERQRHLARERFGIEASVVPNAVEVPREVPPGGGEVLWVGMLRPEKRPEAVLDLARALPGAKFTVVGGAPPRGAPGGEAARAFLRAAAALPNVACAGFQRPDRVDRFYARAAVVINTSPVEGFPTALIEGWARGRPSVTCAVDPDEVICRHGLGVHARGLDAMARALGALLDDPVRRRRMGEDARRYVESRHGVGPVVDRLEPILKGLVRTTRPEGRHGRN